jgi:hypothetical protein
MVISSQNWKRVTLAFVPSRIDDDFLFFRINCIIVLDIIVIYLNLENNWLQLGTLVAFESELDCNMLAQRGALESI